MLRTIRETIASLKDKQYGNVIVSKRMMPVIWYWTQYLLIFTVIPWLIFVFLLTYFLPQLPRAIKDYLPDAAVSLKDGRFSTTLQPQPYIVGDKTFSLIINPSATSSSELTKYESGVLIASSGAYLKSPDGSSDSAQFPTGVSFATNKSQIISWVSDHQSRLWIAGFITITVVAVFISGIYWLTSLVGFAFGGLAFWLYARYTHRILDYRGAVKIAVYAAVLPFLIGALFSASSNVLISLINIVVFAYFGYQWIQNLPKQP